MLAAISSNMFIVFFDVLILNTISHLEIRIFQDNCFLVVRVLKHIGCSNFTLKQFDVRTVDFLIGGKDKHLSIQLAKEVLGDIMSMLRVDSSKRCINNKWQLVVTQANQGVIQ